MRKNPFRKTRSFVGLPRPGINAEPLSPEDVEAVRNWTLKGVPTSAPIVLSLIESYYEARGSRT